MISKRLTWTLITCLGLLIPGPGPGVMAQNKGGKKLSLAELAALEWKLEQASKALTTKEDAAGRIKAVEELMSLADPRSRAPLAMALKEDPDPGVRLKAAEALAEFRSPEALGLLNLAEMADPDVGVKAAAKALLKKFPKRMSPAALPLQPRPFRQPAGKVDEKLLRQTLTSPSGDARLWAVKELGTAKLKDTDTLLADLMAKDPSGRVRVDAARLLATLRQKEALPQLIKAADDGDPSVRFELARIIAEFDDPGALSVIQKMAASDGNETVKAEAKDLLEPSSVIGKRLLSDRIKKLQSENPVDRISSLESLEGFTHWRAMVPMSCALLNDKSPLVRQAATKILPDMHDVSVMIALRAAAVLETDKKLQGTVRKMVEGLFKKVDQLIKQLSDKDPKKRMLAARALGQGAYPPGLAALIGALKDEDPRVRLAAVEGLQNFEDKKAEEALKVAGADKDAKVRAEVDQFFGAQRKLESYRKIYKDPNRIVTWTLDKSPQKRVDAAIALGIAGAERAEGNLAKLLFHDKEESVRLAAAWALVLMASDRAENALKMAGEKDASEKVRLSARRYLILGKVSRDDIIAQLSDDDAQVRQDAAEALSLMANAQVLNHLIKAALCDPMPAGRASSLRGLARIGNPLAKTVIKVLMTRDPDDSVRRAAMVMHILAGG